MYIEEGQTTQCPKGREDKDKTLCRKLGTSFVFTEIIITSTLL